MSLSESDWENVAVMSLQIMKWLFQTIKEICINRREVPEFSFGQRLWITKKLRKLSLDWPLESSCLSKAHMKDSFVYVISHWTFCNIILYNILYNGHVYVSNVHITVQPHGNMFCLLCVGGWFKYHVQWNLWQMWTYWWERFLWCKWLPVDSFQQRGKVIIIVLTVRTIAMTGVQL